jgi:putative ABC transport system permease protein
MFRFIPLMLKNTRRNRRRTTLTVLSVAVSMCLLGVLIAVYHALYMSDPTPIQALRLVTRNRISLAVPLPQAYGQRVEHVPGVRLVMVQQWYGGVYKDARDPKNFFARFAVEPEKLFSMFPEFRLPEDQKQAFIRDQTGCVVGRNLANKFNFHLGDRITLTGDIFPGTLELTVRAIFDNDAPTDVLFFNRKYLEEGMTPDRRGNVGTFDIMTADAATAPRVATAVDDMFRNSPAQTRTESEQAFALSFVAFLGNVKLFLLSISGAVMFTILLVSANTMAMSVRERVREVGVMKTLGFTPGTILGVILGEACVISLAGGAIGALLGALLTGVVRNSPGGAFVTQLRPFEPSVIAACLLAAVAIGAVSSFLPAWNVSRTGIIDALRSTD